MKKILLILIFIYFSINSVFAYTQDYVDPDFDFISNTATNNDITVFTNRIRWNNDSANQFCIELWGALVDYTWYDNWDNITTAKYKTWNNYWENDDNDTYILSVTCLFSDSSTWSVATWEFDLQILEQLQALTIVNQSTDEKILFWVNLFIILSSNIILWFTIVHSFRLFKNLKNRYPFDKFRTHL
jgi:hypothetical protein